MIERIALSQGGRVTSVEPATNRHRHRFRQLHRRCRQRDSAAESRPHRGDRGCCRPYRLVPDRPGHIRIEAGAEHSCHRRRLHCRRHSQIRLRRQCAGQSLRRRGRKPDRGQAAGIAEADRRLLQHGGAGLCIFAVRRLCAEGRIVQRGRRRRHQPARCAARDPRARGGNRAEWFTTITADTFG